MIKKAAQTLKAFEASIKEYAPVSIYIHWPFCKKICPYCDYNRIVRESVDHENMQKAYLKLIDKFFASEYFNEHRRIESIFFGGGFKIFRHLIFIEPQVLQNQKHFIKLLKESKNIHH